MFTFKPFSFPYSDSNLNIPLKKTKIAQFWTCRANQNVKYKPSKIVEFANINNFQQTVYIWNTVPILYALLCHFHSIENDFHLLPSSEVYQPKVF